MKKILFVSLILFSISCSPKINYLGDTFSPTSDVDVYYDEGDVRRAYRVMGLMTADSYRSLDAIKEKMIESARANGADGIIFRGFYAQQSELDIDQNVVEGKLIKYKK